MKKILMGCISFFIGTVGVLFIALVVMVFGSENGYFPDTDALPRGKIHQRYIQELKELEIINKDEEVYFFYSDGMFSIEEDGNLFTNKRVISYESFEDKFNIYSASYSEIEMIEYHKAIDWEDDSYITVTLFSGDWFTLFVGGDSNMGENFFKKLNATYERNKNHEQIKAVE